MDNSIWDKWNDVHSDPEQVKRFSSAAEAACTPVLVNSDDNFAYFQSKRGKYETFLDSCNCTDFKRRGLPCKHMYRLAMELHIMPGEYSSYSHGGYTWKQSVEIIERMSEEIQQYFYHSCFYKAMKKNEPFRIKKASELDVLISSGFLVEYPDKETPKFKTVSVIEDFFVEKQKVHYYFSRKFNPRSYFNGVEMVEDPLPEDEITVFLRERGFAQ